MIDNFLKALTTVPVGALLVTPKVHLLMGTLAFSGTTPIASFTALEATFTGYAAQPLPTLTGPGNMAVATRGMIANNNFLAGPTLTVANTLYGYWVDAGATVDWVLAELFPTPIPISLPGDFLDLGIMMPLLGVVPAQ
jgi:hypothetical protein